MTVRKFLDLSTGHLTQATRNLMDSADRPINAVYPHPDGYGWLVYVPLEVREETTEPPADLRACLRWARHLKCDYILFDCDGPLIEELPSYDDDYTLPPSPLRTTPNARMWFYWHGDYVKVTLRPGQCLQFGFSVATDEGFSSEAVILEHRGDHVYESWGSMGRDCDGKIMQGGEGIARLDRLDGNTGHWLPRDVPGTPVWEQGRSEYRDHQAEAAGY